MHELVSDGTNDIKLSSEDKGEGALYFGLNRSGYVENVEIRIKIIMKYRERTPKLRTELLIEKTSSSL
jgi:hypothetical protein